MTATCFVRLVLTCLLVANSGYAQRLFTIDMDSTTRSYFLVDTGDETTPLPVFILLHDEKMMPTSLARLGWNRLRQPALIVIPVATRGRWGCEEQSDSLKADEQFLLKTVFQVRNNFKVDASRIFIIGTGSSFCLARQFADTNPTLVRAAIRWNPRVESTAMQRAPIQSLDSLALFHPSREEKRAEPVLAADMDSRRPGNDELYSQRTWLAFHIGRWQHAKGSRADFDTLTFTDLRDYHLMFGFAWRYHFTTHWSASIGSDIMVIPKEKNINSISWGSGGLTVDASGKGGVVIPYGLGVRYSLDTKFRPFLEGSLGSTFMFVGGGKASGGIGNINKSIYKRKESVLRYALATGVQFPLGRGTVFQLSAQYAFSSRIDPPLASVNRFDGLYVSFGFEFLLGK